MRRDRMTDYHLAKDSRVGGKAEEERERKEERKRKEELDREDAKVFLKLLECVSPPHGRKSCESLLAKVACPPFFTEQLSSFFLFLFVGRRANFVI